MNGIPLPPPLFKGAPCNMPVALPWPSPAVHHSIMHNCTSIYQHLPSASTHSRCCTREAALHAQKMRRGATPACIRICKGAAPACTCVHIAPVPPPAPPPLHAPGRLQQQVADHETWYLRNDSQVVTYKVISFFYYWQGGINNE